jgi:hypothetical protein
MSNQNETEKLTDDVDAVIEPLLQHVEKKITGGEPEREPQEYQAGKLQVMRKMHTARKLQATGRIHETPTCRRCRRRTDPQRVPTFSEQKRINDEFIARFRRKAHIHWIEEQQYHHAAWREKQEQGTTQITGQIINTNTDTNKPFKSS